MEQHSVMRFAWLRKKQGTDDPTMSTTARLIYIGYNVIWWLPVLLVILGVWSYRAGAVGFVVVTVFRALANLYRNNMLPIEAAQRFPLRSP
ncbi:MAG: hypothetical protein MUQ27_00940 [Acidimicrobiia bacterium]|nr:hypothetical protein [Acidimicrobiia bacterium]